MPVHQSPVHAAIAIAERVNPRNTAMKPGRTEHGMDILPFVADFVEIVQMYNFAVG